jgi:hypothetical protein
MRNIGLQNIGKEIQNLLSSAKYVGKVTHVYDIRKHDNDDRHAYGRLREKLSSLNIIFHYTINRGGAGKQNSLTIYRQRRLFEDEIQDLIFSYSEYEEIINNREKESRIFKIRAKENNARIKKRIEKDCPATSLGDLFS